MIRPIALATLLALLPLTQTDCFGVTEDHWAECNDRFVIVHQDFPWLMSQCWGPDGAINDFCSATEQEFADARVYLQEQCGQYQD